MIEPKFIIKSTTELKKKSNNNKNVKAKHSIIRIQSSGVVTVAGNYHINTVN
jgi:hypothetical protein